jgi:hypothetical protein
MVRGLYGETREQAPLTTASTWRASSLAFLCAREQVYAIRSKSKLREKMDADVLFNLNVGTGFHYLMQNIVLPQLRVIYGAWRCVYCGQVRGTLNEPILRPESCCTQVPSSDATRGFLFEEFDLYEPGWRLTGHCDGLLKLPGRVGFGVLELKTISERESKKIANAPKAEHVAQCNAYMHTLDVEWGLVFYQIKGIFDLDKALVDYLILRDSVVVDDIGTRLTDLWDAVERAHAGDHSEEALPARVCATPTCQRAHKCSFVRRCFDLPLDLAEPGGDYGF